MHTTVKIGIVAGIIIVIVVGGGTALLYVIVGDMEDQLGINMTIEELEALRTDASYEELVVNNDLYIGSVVQKTGKIISIGEISFGEPAYIIDSDGEYYMLYDPTVRYEDLGYAAFYGTVAGLRTVQVSGQDVSAVVLNGEDIILSDAPFN